MGENLNILLYSLLRLIVSSQITSYCFVPIWFKNCLTFCCALFFHNCRHQPGLLHLAINSQIASANRRCDKSLRHLVVVGTFRAKPVKAYKSR